MPKLRDIEYIAAKWQRKAQAASTDYEEGVKNPLKSWQAGALAAVTAWEQGVQQAVARKAFGAGVRAAGDAKWQKGAVEKGARRFGEGVGLAREAYRVGFEPYKAALEGLTLPPRGPKGDPRNYDIARKVGETLHQVKLRRKGAGGGS